MLPEGAAQRAASLELGPGMAAVPAGMSRWRPSQDLVEPLSDRELEILARLAQRESNKEIADRLFIATSTVKRHTLNIYRKLDVNDRRDAVVRGQALGLLAAMASPPGAAVQSDG